MIGKGSAQKLISERDCFYLPKLIRATAEAKKRSSIKFEIYRSMALLLFRLHSIIIAAQAEFSTSDAACTYRIIRIDDFVGALAKLKNTLRLCICSFRIIHYYIIY